MNIPEIAHLSCETQVLLQAIAPLDVPEVAARLQQTDPDTIDWSRLRDLATYHHVLPLLYHNLSQRAPSLMPRSVQEQWKTAFELNAQRNLLLTSELLRLGKLLATENITILPFKGPVLAQQLYDNIALRQFGDLDILVRRADIPRLDALLRAQGYVPEHATEHFDTQHFEAAMRFFRANAFVYYHEKRSVKLEVHWCFLPRKRLFPEPQPGFWEHLDTVTVGGLSFPALTPEHRLFYLAVHGSKHGWYRLSWLLDFAVAATTYHDIDWITLYRAAREAGSDRMVLTSVLAAKDLLGVPVPPELDEMVQHDQDTLAEIIRRSPLMVFTLDGNLQAIPDEAVGERATLYFQTLHRTRWIDKARFWQEQFILPRLQLLERHHLSPTLFPLYYLLNPGVRLQQSMRKLFGTVEAPR